MSKNVVYVIGHKNPDTDSVCSAIALAELKAAEGMDNVVAARAGDINPQTAFILDYLGIKPPRYLPDVYPKARDIMSEDVVTVPEATPLLKVMEVMRRQDIRFIPVLDPRGRPSGVVTIMEMAKRYFEKIEAEGVREVFTSFGNVVSTLNADKVLDFLGDEEKVFSVYVAAMEEESFLRIIGEKEPGECVVIVGDRTEIQKRSIEVGVGLLVISGGLRVEGRIVEEAKKKRVSIAVSPYDSATTALLVRLSTPAYKTCDRDFEKASPDELADDLKYRMAKTSGIIVLDGEGVMHGIITKSNMLKPSTTSLILVDHNELSQAVDGAERVNILEVIDHHRIGGIHTHQAIPFLCDPVGSTSTLVAELYMRRGVPIKKETAGLLLGGVLSDTVMLKSPTTTERDASIVKWLEENSGLDYKDFGAEIFRATSSLKKRTPGEVVIGDHKVFEAKGKRFGIGQVETIGFEEFYEEKERLKGVLEKTKREKDLKLSALLVTDIVYGTSLLLAVGEKKVLYNLGYPELEENVYELKNVISRKKQVVPHVLSVFNEVY